MADPIQTKKIELTPEQEAAILEIFKVKDEPTLSEVTQTIFSDESLNGQTRQGRAVKKFCKDNNLNFKTTTFTMKGLLDLTDEQVQFIKNNFRVKTSLDMVREIYANEALTNFSQEFNTIDAKVKEIQAEVRANNDIPEKDEMKVINVSYNPEELVAGEYKAPKTIKQTIDRINHYLNYGYSEDTLKKQQKFEVEQLKRYLNIFRFTYQINTYKMQGDRDLFEDAFIRYTHDKPDLTQEDLDQFITLCNHIVRSAEIQRRVEDIRTMIITDGLSMKVNEAINVLQKELNDCETLKNRLYNDLTTKRNKRLEEKSDGAEKLINLVLAWKDEEFRARTIHLADLEKMRVRDECGKINSMSEIKALLRGATIEELVN